jgi:hypothetical protein
MDEVKAMIQIMDAKMNKMRGMIIKVKASNIDIVRTKEEVKHRKMKVTKKSYATDVVKSDT